MVLFDVKFFEVFFFQRMLGELYLFACYLAKPINRGVIIMEEQNKFLAWHAEETARGLIDVKFFAGDGCFTKNSNSEDFFREANTVNTLFEQGTVVERKDVF